MNRHIKIYIGEKNERVATYFSTPQEIGRVVALSIVLIGLSLEKILKSILDSLSSMDVVFDRKKQGLQFFLALLLIQNLMDGDFK